MARPSKPRRAARKRSGARSGVPYLAPRPLAAGGILWRWSPTKYPGWPTVSFRDPGSGAPMDLGPAQERARAWNDNVAAWRDAGGPGPEAFTVDPSGWPVLSAADAARHGARAGRQDLKTLDHVADMYRRSDAWRRVARQTQLNFEWSYRLLQPLIGDVAVAAIDKAVAQETYETLARQGRGDRTLQQAMQTLSRLTNFAAKHGVPDAPGSPVADVEYVRPMPRIRVASWAEEAALLAAADALQAWDVRAAVVVATDTTQRLGDIRHALLDHVAEGRWDLTQRKARRAGFIVNLRIKLTPRVLEIVAERRRRAMAEGGFGHNAPPQYLLVDPTDGFRPYANPAPYAAGGAWESADKYAYRRFNVRWRMVRDLAVAGDPRRGLPPCPSLADFQFRDLRDTGVTRLADAGCTVPEICAMTGHSLDTVTQILAHYLAQTETQAASAADKLAALHAAHLKGE